MDICSHNNEILDIAIESSLLSKIFYKLINYEHSKFQICCQEFKTYLSSSWGLKDQDPLPQYDLLSAWNKFTTVAKRILHQSLFPVIIILFRFTLIILDINLGTAYIFIL